MKVKKTLSFFLILTILFACSIGFVNGEEDSDPGAGRAMVHIIPIEITTETSTLTE